MKTKLIGVIICMLLVGTVLPVSGTSLIDKTITCNVSGNTLYVGGSGEGNYTKIQDAIDSASDEDTVFVYDDSSPYYENVVVDKSIFLIGENRDTTVIDGNDEEGKGDVVIIKADGVTVQGFTIQNSSHSNFVEDYGCGIEIRSDNNIIKNNVIIDNDNGIQIGYLNKPHQLYVYSNLIINNEILYNKHGVQFIYATESKIEENIISYNHVGIELSYRSDKNIVINNNIYFNEWAGIYLSSDENKIKRNEITNSKYGVNSYSFGNELFENNIYNHEKNVNETGMIWYFLLGFNKWDSNYWGQPLQEPVKIPIKCYFGFLGILGLIFGDEPLFIWLYLYDRHPASEPYDI